MLTTLENAHNAWKCSQLVKMLTTLENHNLPNANNIGYSYNFWNRLQHWIYNTPNRCTHKSSKRSQLSISPKLCVNSSPPTWNFCDRHWRRWTANATPTNVSLYCKEPFCNGIWPALILLASCLITSLWKISAGYGGSTRPPALQTASCIHWKSSWTF